jgi:hypothetical protein
VEEAGAMKRSEEEEARREDKQFLHSQKTMNGME